MATIFHPRPNYMPAETTGTNAHTHVRSSLYIVPVARFLFAIMFVLAGVNHFSSGSISYAASQGIPMADILVPISGVLALVGGLSVITGFHARVGAVLLLIFMIPVTFLMHNFWAVADPQMAQMQMSHFLKNISMIGGALLITFYGAGPFSVDNHMAKRKSRR
jgi:putative oxidoreductase